MINESCNTSVKAVKIQNVLPPCQSVNYQFQLAVLFIENTKTFVGRRWLIYTNIAQAQRGQYSGQWRHRTYVLYTDETSDVLYGVSSMYDTSV